MLNTQPSIFDPLSIRPKESKNNTLLKPFIKWVGGKRALLPELTKRLPKTYNNYYEPFVGGGALLFELQPKHAFISDINEELIMAYLTIKNNPTKLMNALDIHLENHNEDYYYEVRKHNHLANHIKVVSRFIYLNKTCFNGLYRVNKKGEFNVPSGKYDKNKVSLYDKDNILKLSHYLKNNNVDLKIKNYDQIQAKKGDFVYFDPPYYQTFTQYNKRDFGYEDQVRLAKFIHLLDKKGVYIMLSNSNTDLINKLYKKFNKSIVKAPRLINCKANNRKGEELIITNYDARWDI